MMCDIKNFKTQQMQKKKWIPVIWNGFSFEIFVKIMNFVCVHHCNVLWLCLVFFESLINRTVDSAMIKCEKFVENFVDFRVSLY